MYTCTINSVYCCTVNSVFTFILCTATYYIPIHFYICDPPGERGSVGWNDAKMTS